MQAKYQFQQHTGHILHRNPTSLSKIQAGQIIQFKYEILLSFKNINLILFIIFKINFIY